jgi:hypothetical protein
MGFSGADYAFGGSQPEHFDLALFEEWSEFCEPDIQQKPPIRIIQHQSCTGGTLIAKCLASMPNVALMSEVHPLSQVRLNSKLIFAPSDLAYLAFKGRFPLIDELAETIFKAEIEVISKHTNLLGKYLVLREHSHSDFFVGETAGKSSTLRRLLKEDYPILSVLTVRHPVDSYLSLRSNGWALFKPATFDEYCGRYLLFIDHNENIPLYKYEDFIRDPDAELKQICRALELPFSDDFKDVFDLNDLTGNSGRSSNIIAKRERRGFHDGFQQELEESLKYQKLVERLNYDR